MIICPGDGGLSHSFRIEMDHFSIASYNTFALYTTSGPHTRVLRPGFLVIHVALLASVDSIQFPADGGKRGNTLSAAALLPRRAVIGPFQGLPVPKVHNPFCPG